MRDAAEFVHLRENGDAFQRQVEENSKEFSKPTTLGNFTLSAWTLSEWFCWILTSVHFPQGLIILPMVILQLSISKPMVGVFCRRSP